MDKRVTKITVISTIVTIIIVVLVMGADGWFSIDLGVFKWVIFAVVITVNCIVAASQATQAQKQQGKSK